MASVNLQLLFKLLFGCVSGGKEALPISHCVENIETLFLPSIIVTLEPAAESLVVCPGDTANYVCTEEGSIGIDWQVCCRSSPMDFCLPETIAATRSQPMNTTICGILFTFDFVQGTSHFNITIPLHSTALLDIQCQNNQSRVLQVISTGEIDVRRLLFCLLPNSSTSK